MMPKQDPQAVEQPAPHILNDKPANEEARKLQEAYMVEFEEMKFWQRAEKEIGQILVDLCRSSASAHMSQASNLEGRFTQEQTRALRTVTRQQRRAQQRQSQKKSSPPDSEA